MKSAPFMFGYGFGAVSAREWKRCEAHARNHGATFVSADMPEGPRYWFEAPNKGEPFNHSTARAVMGAVGRVSVSR